MRGRSLVWLLALYLPTELLLAFLLHTQSPSYPFSYASVVLAALACLALYEPTPNWLLTATALLFTLGADLFLVVLDAHYTVAMLLFSVTQLAYAARLSLGEGKRLRRVQLSVRAAAVLAAVSATVAVLGKDTDALAVIALFYFANLLTNAAFAAAKWRRAPLFAIGLWLFVLCDIFVGFGMLGEYLPLGDGALLSFLADPPLNMAWVFYLPSQVLLSLSFLHRDRLRISKSTPLPFH
ncbi:MAG: hypothetical protein IJF73_04745 [Clostridia bacterium]|nr:hypothetical protein [Clostridia bacterium]